MTAPTLPDADSPAPTATAAPPAPPSAAQTRAHLDRSLVRGLAWTGGVKWLTQFATWGSTIVVARLLTPDDYGLVGMATVYLGLVTLLSEFGIGAAVLTMRDLDEHQIAQINSISILFGLASFAVSSALSVPIGRFFGAPKLPLIIVTLSLTFVVLAFRTVPAALLQRDLRFRGLAALDGVKVIITAIASVLFALAGFGYWTLVASVLLGNVLTTAFTLVLQRARFARPRLADVRESLTFSTHTIVGRIAWYIYQNADFIIAGRLLGKTALGAYNFGWQMASLPVEKVSSMALGVTPGIFSAAQHDRPALKRYALTISEGLALATFPALLGLALLAPDLVRLGLGAKWSAMVVPLQILAVVSMARVITPLLTQILTVTGDQRYVMRLNLVAAVAHVGAFWYASRWGIGGIAAAWLVVYPLTVVYPVNRRVFARLSIAWREYARSLEPAVVGSVAMAAATLGVGALLPADMASVLSLAIRVATGAVAYGVVLLAFYRRRINAFLQALKAVRK